jgi:hypothetical protein
VRVRRDQLVLGAVAAALLVAIVVFAASSSSVKTDRAATPTPTATPASERDLFGGSLEPRVRYRTQSFAPPLSFVPGDGEWIATVTTQPDTLLIERRVRTGKPGGELPSRSAISFERVFNVTDPKTGRPIVVGDLYAWLKRHPDLVVGPRRKVTVAGVPGETFHMAVRFKHPAVSAPVCRRQLTVCTVIAQGRYYPNGVRMRTIVLPTGTAPLVIDITARSQRDLDRIETPATALLQTLRIG